MIGYVIYDANNHRVEVRPHASTTELVIEVNQDNVIQTSYFPLDEAKALVRMIQDILDTMQEQEVNNA